MATEEMNTERATVSTYIPAYQKQRWAEHAEQLGMSQSEFVRTMVQAGRREFEVPDGPETERGSETKPREPSSSPSDPQGKTFEDRVLASLSEVEHLSWDELLASLTDDIEGRLDETLQELQAANAVQYSGRHGGYSLAEGADR